MNKIIREDKGFTLIEIIFSIAFLSIVSVIMLRLLVVSYDIENKTDLVDMASINAINEIENIKALESFTEEKSQVKKYYDSVWSISDENSASFLVEVNVNRDNSFKRGLYDISVVVFELSDEEEVLSINTKHYFNGKE